MKKNALKSITICFATAMLLLTSSCSKNDNPTLDDQENAISDEEAVELVEASLTAETGGLTSTAQLASQELTEDVNLEASCDLEQQETYPYSYSGNLVEANYELIWSYQIACDGLFVAQSALFSVSSTGTYSTQSISSIDNASSSLSVAGLQPSSNGYLFDGSYERSGNQTMSVRDYNREVTSTFTASLTNLLIDKNSYEVLSGEGEFTLTVVNLDNTTTFDGSIVYIGNGRALITLNGNEYEIVIG